jgi:NAD(P)-dependent dehydrogenase (short-subunit alcohol dehydrogenase family)
VVNNAAQLVFAEAEWQTPEQIKSQMMVNVVGGMLVAKVFLPLLRYRDKRARESERARERERERKRERKREREREREKEREKEGERERERERYL